ncbi:MAG: ABC transporter ATP-binding protein [Anaerolineae bacterium]|jgi:ABC-2 type transport system ATP-binding protein
MSIPPAIETLHLGKDFDDKTAVEDLTLTVERGEVFGFLGPNGAGKTTAVKMMLGLIAPTAGEGYVLGQPLGDPRGRRKIGFLPEHFRFHHWLRAREFLHLHADLYQVPRDVARRRVPELLELVGLTDHAEKELRAYSKGMLQRIGLAQALLNQPDLVLLDEPTSGLDPVGRRLVRDVIRDLRNKGASVFLNSHLLSEVEITCDRVSFIKKGRVIHTGPLTALVDGELTVEIRARRRGNVPAERWQAVLDGLRRWSSSVRIDGEHVSLSLPGEADVPAINRYLVKNGADVYALTPQTLSLEEFFIKVVGDEDAVLEASKNRRRRPSGPPADGESG